MAYTIDHNTYTSAVQEAEKYATSRGYEVNHDQMFTDIGINTSRPKEGEYSRFTIFLFKNSKEQRKALHAQVYGKENGRYELNMYIL